MYILGISCYYHDSAATLIKDGQIIAAVQEERFSRKKHDYSFPVLSIKYCLQEAKIDIDKIDYTVFYEKPFIKFERILYTYLSYAPKGIKSFLYSMPLWLKQKIFLKDDIAKKLNYKGKILFSKHHYSHAASAFYPSYFKRAAILTIDAVGEWSTASFGTGYENKINIISNMNFPHSLGLLYSAFTYYLGFKVCSGEYKVMGLAPYGKPEYEDLIFKNLIDLKEDGSFKLNMKYFNYCAGLTMTNKKFNKLFKEKPRKPDDEIKLKHMNIASSIQKVTEKIIIKMANHVYNTTKEENLCLAGGVALNCVANGQILRKTPFKNLWIQPAATDAGAALGAALFVWHEYLNNPRTADNKTDFQKASLLGPVYSNEYIKIFLNKEKIPYKEMQDEQIAEKASELIINQNVLGWFQGRMEFGPRALGARSILADARSDKMQSIINKKIKFRESFRPFAPSVIEEKSGEFFNITSPSPYMLLVSTLKKEKCINITEEKKGFDKLKIKRSDIPAVTHVDYTSRIQTVKRKDNPLYYDLINIFYKKTKCPVIINTSFNIRGEPIVCTPQEAYRCFLKTNMDYLILGKFLISKK